MANITRQITITEEGLKAGPFFDVYYSLDCETYTICSDGSNVYLPVVGSTVNVTLPDNSQCLKLQSLSPDCPGVFVVESLTTTTTTTSTSTTTTTTSGPTTTTTTTAAPTTTTTTTAAPKFWNAIYCNNYQPVPVVLKMAGVATTGSIVEVGTGKDTCATLTTVYNGTPFYFFDKTAATLYVSCDACVGITTTTTSTTTTSTTTPAPVWYTLYRCTDGATVYSQQYPNGTFIVGQRVQYGTEPSILYFNVTAINYSDPGGIQQSVSAVTPFAAGCPATTTTTSTTTQVPITLSVTGSCSGGYGTGRILAQDFAGSTGTYDYIAIGTTESNAIANVTNPSGPRVALSGALSYTFTNLINGNYWVAILDSNNRTGLSSVTAISCGTTTTTSTTTTTISLPGFSFLTNTGRNGSSAACSATKTIYLWAYSNTWDNGITYYEGTISGPTVPLSPYPGASQWFANGGVAIQIDDNGLSSNATACPTTTTTTTSTTTTIAPTTTTTSTTTTTQAPVWYQLYNCANGQTWYSQQFPAGTFNVNDRVQYGIAPSTLYLTVVSSTTTDPGSTYTVSATGDTGCPATTTTTTTTTTPPVDFTYTTSCNNGLGTITITNITGGTGTGYQFSIQPTPGFWYNWPTFTQLSNLASGVFYSVAVRDSAGKGTNKAIFIDCATTTTTTTLAPTTTTTTTGAPGTAYVSVQNNFTNGTITNVTVNGVSIVGASFPLAVGDTTSGTTDQVGTNETVRVYYSGVSPSPSYTIVTDTDFSAICQLTAGTSNRLYTNTVIANGGNVSIYSAEGNCP